MNTEFINDRPTSLPGKVNDRQVGGTHYRSEYQHWDWVVDHNIPYLIGCCTKYILRWRDKNGIEDIDKALHYVEKYIDSGMVNAFDRAKFRSHDYQLTRDFISANKIEEEEADLLWKIMALVNDGNAARMLNEIRPAFSLLYKKAQSAVGGR